MAYGLKYDCKVLEIHNYMLMFMKKVCALCALYNITRPNRVVTALNTSLLMGHRVCSTH